jgi:hypothetical protein
MGDYTWRKFLGSLFGCDIAASIPTTANVYEAAITYAEEKNILEPMSDGLMHPEMPISRQDIVVSIVRDVYGKDIRQDCFDRISANLPARFTHLFTDVSLTNTSAKELCVGMFVGLVEGQKDGSFAPQAGANLVDAAKIVSKAYGIAPLPSLEVQNNVPWHEPFWFALARKNAIPESVKNRSSMLTRGEFAEILYRLRDERPTQGFRYKPTMVKDIAQENDVAEVVTDSFTYPSATRNQATIFTHAKGCSRWLPNVAACSTSWHAKMRLVTKNSSSVLI